MSTAVFLFVAIACAGAAGWFWWQARTQQKSGSVRLDSLNGELDETRRARDGLQQRLELADEQNVRLQQELERSATENRKLQEIKGRYNQMLENEQKLEERIKNITSTAIDKANKELEERSNKSLGTTVKPIREEMKTLRERMEEINKENSNERTLLQSAIGNTLQTAKDLTQALTKKSKVRGNLGEWMLKNALESLGFKEGHGYVSQEHIKSADGKTQFADCIISLPGGRKIIVDSKFLLNHWHEHINTDDEAAAAESLKKHADAIKKQVADMAERNYPASVRDALDFTLLFIPLDLAVYRAFEEDDKLFQYAWDKKIGIISPSTLLPTLRIIDNLWEMEKQRGNHQAIVDHAQKMVDKFSGVLDSQKRLGKQIDTVRNTYDTAMKQLSIGQGSLHRQFEQLGKFGISGKKKRLQSTGMDDDDNADTELLDDARAASAAEFNED